MAYATKVGEFSRRPIYALKIVLGRCANVFGNAPCTATGTVCHYSAPTCKDIANFVDATKDWWFSSAFEGAAGAKISVGDCRPYILNVSGIASRIDPEQGTTVAARVEIEMAEDWGTYMPHAPDDHDKGASKYRTESGGEFWRNLKARHPNYRGRKVYLYEGFDGDAEADLKLLFAGVFDLIQIKDGQVKLTMTDPVKRLHDERMPPPVRSSNITTHELTASDTAIPVEDASEFKMLPQHLYIAHDDAGDSLWRLHYVDHEDATIVEAEEAVTRPGTLLKDCAWDPRTRRMFIMRDSGAGLLYSIAKDSHILTEVGSSQGDGGLAYDIRRDLLWSINGSTLYQVDKETGTGTSIGATGYANINGLAHDPVSDILYAIDDTANSLLTLNKTTGSATVVGSVGAGIWMGLAYDRVSKQLFTIDQTDTSIKRINPATGSATSLGIPTGLAGESIMGLDFAPPAEAFIRITDDSAIGYDEYLMLLGVDEATSELDVLREGLIGTTARAHGLGVKVHQVAMFIDAFSGDDESMMKASDAYLAIMYSYARYHYTEFDRASYIADVEVYAHSTMVSRIIEKPIAIEESLRKIRLMIQLNVVYSQSEGIIKAFTLHPVNRHTNTLVQINDSENIIQNFPPDVDSFDDMQVTRVIVGYNPIDPSSESKELSGYLNTYIKVDRDAESESFYGQQRPREIMMPWIRREREALILAYNILRRYKNPPSKYILGVDPKDYNIEVGQVIEVTSRDFLSASGDQMPTQFEVLTREDVRRIDGFYNRLEVLETKFVKRYGFIAHPATPTYASASATDKYHCFIGSASVLDDAGNVVKAVMSNGDDGYYIY